MSERTEREEDLHLELLEARATNARLNRRLQQVTEMNLQEFKDNMANDIAEMAPLRLAVVEAHERAMAHLRHLESKLHKCEWYGAKESL